MSDQKPNETEPDPTLADVLNRARVRRENDVRLLSSIKVGDAETYGRLFDGWVDPVHDRVVRAGVPAADVDAVVTATFSTAWRDVSRGRIGTSFGAGVLRHALREAQPKRSALMVPAGAEDRLTRATDLEAVAEDAGVGALLYDAANALGQKAREALDLRVRQGLTVAEVATVLGMPVAEAKELLRKLPSAFEAAVWARILYATASADKDLAAALKKDGVTSFGSQAVRTISARAKVDPTLRARGTVALGAGAVFAAMPTEVASAETKKAVAGTLAGTGVPLGRSEFAQKAARPAAAAAAAAAAVVEREKAATAGTPLAPEVVEAAAASDPTPVRRADEQSTPTPKAETPKAKAEPEPAAPAPTPEPKTEAKADPAPAPASKAEAKPAPAADADTPAPALDDGKGTYSKGASDPNKAKGSGAKKAAAAGAAGAAAAAGVAGAAAAGASAAEPAAKLTSPKGPATKGPAPKQGNAKGGAKGGAAKGGAKGGAATSGKGSGAKTTAKAAGAGAAAGAAAAGAKGAGVGKGGVTSTDKLVPGGGAAAKGPAGDELLAPVHKPPTPLVPKDGSGSGDDGEGNKKVLVGAVIVAALLLLGGIGFALTSGGSDDEAEVSTAPRPTTTTTTQRSATTTAAPTTTSTTEEAGDEPEEEEVVVEATTTTTTAGGSPVVVTTLPPTTAPPPVTVSTTTQAPKPYGSFSISRQEVPQRFLINGLTLTWSSGATPSGTPFTTSVNGPNFSSSDASGSQGQCPGVRDGSFCIVPPETRFTYTMQVTAGSTTQPYTIVVTSTSALTD